MSGERAERFIVTGRVQGVGFRWWTVGTAQRLGLRGWVRNRRDGSVEIQAIGPADRIETLALACETGPRAARVGAVQRFPAEDDGTTGFDERSTI
jgi:acylphosphatase